MNKRLRKKKFIGEFKEWGVSISVTRSTDDDFDVFLDEFVEQGMEKNACYFTGTSKDDSLEGFMDLGRSLGDAEAKLVKVTAWLGERSDVKTYTVGTLTDAWYGPFDQHDEPE